MLIATPMIIVKSLETTQCSPMGEWINKHLHNGISHNSQNKWITATHTQSLNLSTDIKWKKNIPKDFVSMIPYNILNT